MIEVSPLYSMMVYCIIISTEATVGSKFTYKCCRILSMSNNPSRQSSPVLVDLGLNVGGDVDLGLDVGGDIDVATFATFMLCHIEARRFAVK